MEHSLHIACKHFVEAVAPVSPSAICKKMKMALKHPILDFDDMEYNSEADEDNSEDEYTSGDALGKALALVKQVNF